MTANAGSFPKSRHSQTDPFAYSVDADIDAPMQTRDDRLFLRALQILDGKASGFGLPKMRHLALRGYGAAMLDLANRETQNGLRNELGRISDRSSPLALTYRAYRMGEQNAAQNMAMSYYNVGDLAGYRNWLHRAAQAGDFDAKVELGLFEIRKPHRLARRLRRWRPHRRDGN
jgi:hypothetical protein